VISIVEDQGDAKSFCLLWGYTFDGRLRGNRHECREERDAI
jgi:hypothetical protein